MKDVLQIHLPCSWETTLTGDLCPLNKGRQRIRPVCSKLINTMKPMLGRGPVHKATFEPSAIRRVWGAENIVADNWPMISSEVKSLLNTAILQMDGERRQQGIHLRLFLGSRYKEIFHRAPGAASGRCNLCPCVIGTQIKLTYIFSQACEFVKLPSHIMSHRPPSDRETHVYFLVSRNCTSDCASVLLWVKVPPPTLPSHSPTWLL